MRHSTRNIISVAAIGLLFYLPTSQATGLIYSQHVPAHGFNGRYNGHQAGISFITGRRGHNRAFRGGIRGNRFGHSRGNRSGHNRGFRLRQRLLNHGRGFNGHNRGFNQGLNRGHRRGNLNRFGHQGHHQKRRYSYRDRFGRLHYFYR